ncbi:MAG: helix-turn-helix domain-containing protein [Cyanobacteria bacterium J06560_6]
MTRGPLAQKFWESIPPERQKEIEKRAARRIAEYQNLQALRQSAGLTQRKVCEELDMTQGNLSRLERNSDMLLSTLQKYVAAIGGKLHLTVELPDKAPISLTGLGDLIEPTSSLPE